MARNPDLGRKVRRAIGSAHLRISRALKYTLLFAATSVTLYLVFDAFSFYVARTSIDAEIAAADIPSIEYLSHVARSQQGLTIASLESRCQEREQLAALRVLSLDDENRFQKAYDKLYDARSAVIKGLVGLGTEPAYQDAANEFAKLNSDITKVYDVLPATAALDPQSDLYKKVQGVRADLTTYVGLRNDMNDVRDAIARNRSTLFEHSAIDTLEDRIKRLKGDFDALDKEDSNKGKARELFLRYSTWTESLSGGLSGSQILTNELSIDMAQANRKSLRELDCDALRQFFTAVSGYDLSIAPDADTGFFATIGQLPTLVERSYKQALSFYFIQPPVAQTLYVTLLMGMLGGLTLNILRLSKVGWWEAMHDPNWGEVIVCPFLGALAAFGVFLVGSTGLLLASAGSTGPGGTTQLSAVFIGLLGLVSGLLYDEAFGRVRRVGSQILLGGSADSLPVQPPSESDIALAGLLDQTGAVLFAETVTTQRLGSRLEAEDSFTLLVPSNDAITKLPVGRWRRSSGVNDPAGFNDWYRAHHSADAWNGAAAKLTMDDGSTLDITDSGDVVGGLAVIGRIPWRKGTIIVLAGELPAWTVWP